MKLPTGTVTFRAEGGGGQLAPDRGPLLGRGRPGLAGRGLCPRRLPSRRPLGHPGGQGAGRRGPQPHEQALGADRPVLAARWEERYRDALRLAGAADTLREQDGGRASLDFLAGVLGDPEAEAWARLPTTSPSRPGRRAAARAWTPPSASAVASKARSRCRIACGVEGRWLLSGRVDSCLPPWVVHTSMRPPLTARTHEPNISSP
jgi:hypothetical protein